MAEAGYHGDVQKFNNIHPLRFGDLSIWPPFSAAPMAGYTDAVFRDIQREFGCPCVLQRW